MIAGSADDGDDPAAVARLAKEILEGSDRIAATVGAAVIDDRLRYALEHAVLQESEDRAAKAVKERFFGMDGALGPFAPRVELGYLLGLYSDEARSEMKTIAKIRNYFAHRASAESFDDEAVRRFGDKLILGERHTVEAVDSGDKAKDKSGVWKIGIIGRDELLKARRGRFLASVQVITFGLSPGRKPLTAEKAMM